ncbi:hypothetical protein B0H17DRAFT_876821, partial [Mycena rosella]
LLTLSKSPEEATKDLYGVVRIEGDPITVYVAVSCKNPGKPYSKAGFAVYWGLGDAHNTSYRIVDGSESQAAFIMVLYTVLTAPADRPLVLYSSSQYAIRTFCYWAGKYAMAGWIYAHGDIL